MADDAEVPPPLPQDGEVSGLADAEAPEVAPPAEQAPADGDQDATAEPAADDGAAEAPAEAPAEAAVAVRPTPRLMAPRAAMSPPSRMA